MSEIHVKDGERHGAFSETGVIAEVEVESIMRARRQASQGLRPLADKKRYY